jgi:copper chaperone CopZ
MKKTYEISGMSCGGCVSNVKSALLNHPDVKVAEVHLHPQSAELTMNNPLDLSELQVRLKKAGDYTIKETSTTTNL